MKALYFLVILFTTHISCASASLYDCSSPRPEMAGHHNMVVFGKPDDQVYAYHLPLFQGEVNGQSGHILMHVYQGLWNISLKPEVFKAYKEKFEEKKSDQNKIPFFSISPQKKAFKVPELICEQDFEFEALLVYGHVEGNPNFPKKELFLPSLVNVAKKGKTLFARRFDQSSKKDLTYILFGTEKQLYIAHYLTDNENSFDQILAVDIKNLKSKKNILEKLRFTESLLVAVKSVSNGFKIDADTLNKKVDLSLGGETIPVSITTEVYFNNDNDLKVKF